MNLIATVNKYLAERGRAYNIGPVRSIAEWVTRMLNMFGLGEGAAAASVGQVGWGKAGEEAGAGNVSQTAMSGFRLPQDCTADLLVRGAT